MSGIGAHPAVTPRLSIVYLLDTNVCIDFTLGRSDPLRARVRAARPFGLAISAITLAELRVGARSADADPDDDRRLDLLISTLAVVPFDASAAQAYGRLGRAIGIKHRSFDRLIGAHALALNMTLVSNNDGDFGNIPGLVVENWMQ